jgi:hypothetical protein
LEDLLRLLDDLIVCFGKIQWYLEVFDAFVLVTDVLPAHWTGTGLASGAPGSWVTHRVCLTAPYVVLSTIQDISADPLSTRRGHTRDNNIPLLPVDIPNNSIDSYRRIPHLPSISTRPSRSQLNATGKDIPTHNPPHQRPPFPPAVPGLYP